MDFGAFAQGFVQSYGDGGKADKMRHEEMELQKQLLTSKIAAEKIEQELTKRKLEVILSEFGDTVGAPGAAPTTMSPVAALLSNHDNMGGGAPGAAPTTTASGVPEMIARETVPSMPVTQTSAQPGQAQGMSSKISSLMSRPEGQIALHELFGFVPKPSQIDKGIIEGPDGRPMLQFFSGGDPMPGKGYRRPVEQKPMNVTGPEQEEETFFYDPYNPSRNPGIKTKSPQGETSSQAGRIQLAQIGVNELKTLIPSILNTDGTPNRSRLAAAALRLPGTEGRTVKQSFERAVDAIVRAATGAALNEQEIKQYSDAYFPSPLDDKQGVRNKLAALEEFLNGYLSLMDPTGQQQLRIKGFYSGLRKDGKPSLDLGKKKGQDDPGKMSDAELLKALGAK